MPERLYFLVNPISGNGRAGEVAEEAIRRLRGRGYASDQEAALQVTEFGKIGEQSRAACLRYDRIVAVGGDGTVRDVASGILQAGLGRKLGIIPLGHGNDLSRALGIAQRVRPGDGQMERLLAILLGDRLRRVDVWSVNGVHFCNYLGVGFDARVVRDFARWRGVWRGRLLRSNVLSELTYVLCGVRNLRYRLQRPLRLELLGGGAPATVPAGARTLLLTNLPFYAAGARVSRQAAPDDGRLELTVFRRLAPFLLLLLTRWWPGLPWGGAAQRQITGCEVYGLTSPDVHADGEDLSGPLAGARTLRVARAGQVEVLVP
ncbi:MAG: hypothetical protein HYY85_07680 [Deltaproteobacteria bacterium]|nr:hypothetical protein [Deltaproteobacteria bacterium]